MALSVESARQQLEQEEALLVRTKAELAAAQNQYNQAVASGAVQPGTADAVRLRSRLGISSLQADVETAENAVREARLALEAAQAEEQRARAAAQLRASEPRESTGTTVVEAQTARDDAAGVQSPPTSPLVNEQGRVVPASTPSQTNAVSPTAGLQTDAGTDAPVRRAENLQSTPPATAAPGGLRPGVGSPSLAGPSGAGPGATPFNATAGSVEPKIGTTPIPGQSRGAAAPNDDQTNSTRAEIAQIFGGRQAQIITQPNVLDRFTQYTYNISIYILSPTDYQRLITTKQKVLNGFQLLIRSGGIPLSSGFAPQTTGITDPGEATGVNTQSLLTQGRNQYFPLDYYLDDVQVRSVINGKGTGSAHNVASVNFKLVEPNGITFIDNLKRATQEYVGVQIGGAKKPNYAQQLYLMVIKFMGYDASGNPITVTGGVFDQEGNLEGREAVIEKFIPFRFADIRFRIANNLVEYHCEGVCPQININAGARGVIPYNMEIQARTLQELFIGNRVTGTASAGTTQNRGVLPGARNNNEGLGQIGDIIGA